MNTDTLELENCDIKALLEIARNLTRERDAALKRLNSSERARKSLSEACDYLQAKQDATERLARELRDALQMVNCIDLSPCNGGSCMVATDADDSLDCIKGKATQLITKSNQLLP